MKYLFFIITFNILVYANTTMCYINNIKDISTVELQKFNGSQCKGLYSIKDMQDNNWTIKDIKISQKNDLFNFIYILSNSTNTNINQNIDYKKLSEVVENEKKLTNKSDSIINGEKTYNKNCKLCHGIKGELTPNNNSLKINTLSLEDLKFKMRAYNWNEQDNGTAFIMKPYAQVTTPNDIENIYNYLKKINNFPK